VNPGKLRYVLNALTDNASLLRVHCKQTIKINRKHEYCTWGSETKAANEFPRALLDVELKIQEAVDCPLTSVYQLVMSLRHTAHSKQVMETFLLRMSRQSQENEPTAQLCKASVAGAFLSGHPRTVGKKSHVWPSLKLTWPKKKPKQCPTGTNLVQPLWKGNFVLLIVLPCTQDLPWNSEIREHLSCHRLHTQEVISA
jgi:hypothetical protein